MDGYDAYVEENGAAPTGDLPYSRMPPGMQGAGTGQASAAQSAPTGDFPFETADDETLEVTVDNASLADYEGALDVMEQYGGEPDPAAYGIWVLYQK